MLFWPFENWVARVRVRVRYCTSTIMIQNSTCSGWFWFWGLLCFWCHQCFMSKCNQSNDHLCHEWSLCLALSTQVGCEGHVPNCQYVRSWDEHGFCCWTRYFLPIVVLSQRPDEGMKTQPIGLSVQPVSQPPARHHNQAMKSKIKTKYFHVCTVRAPYCMIDWFVNNS